MTSLRRPYLRTVCALLALLALGAVALFCLRGASRAQAASVGALQQQITSGRGQVAALAGALGAVSARVASLNRSIAGIRAQTVGADQTISVGEGSAGRFRGTGTRFAGQRDLLIELSRGGERLFRSQNRVILQ